MSGKRILSVSYDVKLLSTRAAMLTLRGYEVTSVLGRATEHCKRGGFDLLLLGHSLSDVEAKDMIAAWRTSSDGPVLLVRRHSDLTRGRQYHVDSLDPVDLVEKVATILKE